MSPIEHRRQYWVYLVLTVVCIASRIPELAGDKLLLDGDECVVAIMAKHMMQGKAFSAFFYGQSYGFSLVECLFIIPFYFLLGFTTVSVKLGMLALWTTGVLFLYRAFTLVNKSHKWLPLLFILVFICSPAWAIWSMKARGGYLTSFALTSVVLCLLFGERKSDRVFFYIGLLCFFIYQSQPLWLPGLAPLLGYFLFKDKKWGAFLMFLAPVLLLSVGAYFYKSGMLEFGTIQMDRTGIDFVVRIERIVPLLCISLHGNYYFNERQNPNLFCASLAVMYSMGIYCLIVVAMFRAVRRKKNALLFCRSALSLVFTLVLTIWAPGPHGRYLLPIMGYALLSFLLLLNTIDVKPQFLYWPGIVSIVMGLVAVVTFYDYAFSPLREKGLRNALGYLQEKGIHYAYSDDNMFTWQVIFYSNEQVLCHERLLPGRFPKYEWLVDSAYFSGAKAAYISHTSIDSRIDMPGFEIIDYYYLVADPPKSEITSRFPRLLERPKYYYCRD